ncbi:serine/threonine protein kinase [Verrucomicrobia bacterium LW23]|nr:serine/threonine protein kinase [Verrucomicrobia bacterium LW23]
MKEVVDSETVSTCPNCQGSIDVTGIQVGAEIACPICNHEFTLTRMFGNFLLERQIGQGGMGAVYLGKDTILKRKVAIKLLKTELVEDEKFISTFLFEAQITASLNHPNIVQVYAFGEQRGTYYLVMEHIPGGSLDDKILNNGSVSEQEGLEIGIAIAAGLNFAHQRGLIHRDIKPGNILFGEDGTPKVVDFGLSLAYDSEDHFAGEIWGTPYYVAPEKLEHKPEDWRSDLYSLGTTLFHAMTGRPPYEAEDPTEVAMKHLSGNIVSIRAFVPTISSQTAHAISKSIARYPEDRSASYEEFIEQLEDAKRRLHGDEKEEVKVSILMSQEEETRRSAWLVMVFVGVCVLVAGVFYFFSDAIFKEKEPDLDIMSVKEAKDSKAAKAKPTNAPPKPGSNQSSSAPKASPTNAPPQK